MKHFYPAKKWIYFLLLVLGVQPSFAQNNVCPPNIDFEFGDWTNWQLFAGLVSSAGGVRTFTLNPTAPLPQRHTIVPPTNVLDPYGGFPVNSNGAAGGTSIRLGFPNEVTPNANVERIKYQFTIPAGATSYSITYKYAVVFENPAGHQPWEQPQFEAKVLNVSTGNYIPCASFSYYATSGLPGFSQSTQLSNHGAVVFYKPWTAVTVNLSAFAGQTIALEFTNSDCTLSGHWSYSYIDVVSGCNSPIAGAEFCPGSTSVDVIAPYGYQNYTWFPANFSAPITTNQTMTLTPPPASPTVYAVDLVPFPGYGCRDTIYATVKPLPIVPVNAGIDKQICPTGFTFKGPDTLGSPALPNYTYAWLPTAGLNDPAIAQPIANPTASTNYVVTMTDVNTGCKMKDTVVISVGEPVSATFTANMVNQCFVGNNYQFTSSSTNPTNTTYAWLFENGTNGSSQANPSHQYAAAGNYTVNLTTTTSTGCKDTSSQVMIVSASAIADAGADQTLCSNVSPTTVIGTPAIAGYTYSWSPATGLSSTTIAQPTASPTATISYVVTATAPGGCTKTDTVLLTLVSNLSPTFTVNNASQCLDVNNFQFTMTNPAPGLIYDWNFGDTPPGTSTLQNPSHTYLAAGNYTVKLLIQSPKGCKDSSSQSVTVTALPTGTISSLDSIICEGTPVMLSVAGTPATTYKWYKDGVLVGTTSTPTYNATQAGIYTFTLSNGCQNNGTGAVPLSLTKKPIVDFSYSSSCLGNPSVFTDRSNVTGSLPVKYLWNFGGGVPNSTLQSPTITYPNAGTYNVQFTVTPQYCPALATTATKAVTVKGPTPNVRYPDKAALENVSMQLTARNIGVGYSWSPGTNLNNANIMAPIFNGTQEVDYTITITDAQGCKTVDSVLVKVFKEVNIFMPKAFTPNGDGQNDKIYPYTIGIKQIRMFRILNRWGVVVYEGKNLSSGTGWDGTYKGAPQPMDGYVWELQAVDYFGKNHTASGSFTLLR